MYQLVKAFIDSVRVNLQTFISKQSKAFLVRTEEHSFLSAASSCCGWDAEQSRKWRKSQCFMCSSPLAAQDKCIYSNQSPGHFIKRSYFGKRLFQRERRLFQNFLLQGVQGLSLWGEVDPIVSRIKPNQTLVQVFFKKTDPYDNRLIYSFWIRVRTAIAKQRTSSCQKLM